jgi:hypothetical protein
VHRSEASEQASKGDSPIRSGNVIVTQGTPRSSTTDFKRVVWKQLLPTDMKSNPDLLLKESKNLSARRSAKKKWFFCSVLAQKKN